MGRSFEGIWIPKELWFRKDLSLTEKILYLEIKSLDNDFGCKASNKSLAEPFALKPSTISGLLKSLEEKGWISISYKNMITFEGRVVTIKRSYDTPSEKSGGASEKSIPPSEKSIHSNTISNTISNGLDKSNPYGEFENSPGGIDLFGEKKPDVTLTKKEMFSDFITAFNKQKGIASGKLGKFVGLDSEYKKFCAISKIFSNKQITDALKTAFKDDFHTGNGFKYLTPEYMLRQNIMQRYVNVADEKNETIVQSKTQMVY